MCRIPFIITLQVKLKMQMNEMFEHLTMHSVFTDVACICLSQSHLTQMKIHIIQKKQPYLFNFK